MSCKDEIDLRPAFINTFNKLYNYTSFTSNPLSNYLKPVDNFYGDSILINNDNFKNNISSNIDIDNYSGNPDDVIDNKDNIFIIDNNKNVYENCVVSSGIPWYSTNNKYNKCEIPNNILLDDNNILKFNDDKKTINYNFKSSKKNSAFCTHYSNENKAYCENSWYDWLIIPNYYLGNTYYKDVGKYTENDVYKCYKPCEGDYIPFKTGKNEMKCIPKNLFSGGMLMNKYKYSALGLINLIGNLSTKNELENFSNNYTFINYYLIFFYKHLMNIDNNIYETNDKYDEIINLNNIDNFNKYKDNIKDIENDFFNCIKKEIIDLDNFDNSTNQDFYKLDNFSYKSQEFHETQNDLITLNGLNNNNILIDPILIHIWILANIYRPLEKEDFEESNVNSIINSDTFNNLSSEIKKILYNTELYYKLYSKNISNGDETKNINIAIRLKNIFFKAVNVCYNNKTSFSANIINKTKKALQNKELIDVICTNNFYIFNDTSNTSNILNKNRRTIFNSKDSLRNFLNNTEELDNFKEIYYYNDVELNEFVYNISNKNPLIKTIIGDFGMKSNENNTIDGENNRFKYLFSIEYLELSNTCKINEIYDPVSGLCNLRPPKENIKNLNEGDNVDDIDDQFQLPQMKYFITLFFQVIFIIIIGYIFYLFYNIFGEVFIASINWIYETISDLRISQKLNALDKKIDATQGDLYNSNMDNIKKKVEIELNQAKLDYERIKSKLDTYHNYVNNHRLDKK